MNRRKTRVQQTLQTLKDRGHISVATGCAEHGRYHVGAAIHLLRTTKSRLVPAGHEIVTIMKADSNGNPYAEWRLRPVDRAAA